ncbi:HAMP domain-containing sensor histidine kinase [Thermoflexus sp.]|uniref:HAMP domain-containing sensor histidine kinase n=1 Tax=Thermoflexus sp. TaxID=1969742 RepID=UPI0025FB3BCF|nr:HAMP domain-containing sensor histidine kinase [Thermoflexus sp.]MDW8180462.1 HAMP domain-containing sensor histidine kinase [Anaerolineae bacterium]MCS6963843.1 HAMP domain-containing histidine kinase [Thermoflexus sp.]MCS7351010.1 HAMP domain-containing histidine kinase [Thermoflexus sp.]MCX7691253.1 HAMP domain-containing histidine kinase [Thermoflexus sp.]MDW8184800.1 HAMP domain-containing sensor histidine kinase [Anaerolineae bacterium]
MRGWISAWRAQYLAIALVGASAVYLNLFIALPQEIADLLEGHSQAHQEAMAGLLSAYLWARREDGVSLEAALQEVSPWLKGYTLYALPSDFPVAHSGVSPLGVALADGRQLALGQYNIGCLACRDPAFWFRLLGISLGIWVALLAVHLWLWVRFSVWLKRIRETARAIAAGASNPPLPLSSWDELGQIAESMREIAAALSRFREAQRRFLMTAAHELLMPLSMVIRELEDLRAAPSREEMDRRVEQALAHGWHLQRLMEDVLIAAREDQVVFPLRPEPLDLAELLIAMSQAYAPRFEAMGRRLELHLSQIPLPVRADPVRLRQIFGNLLENALRHSRDEEVIRMIGGQGERVMVEVCGGVFGGPSAGMGLGLYLVDELMRAHRGTMELFEGPEGVLHVRLIFPRSPSPALVEGPTWREEGSGMASDGRIEE